MPKVTTQKKTTPTHQLSGFRILPELAERISVNFQIQQIEEFQTENTVMELETRHQLKWEDDEEPKTQNAGTGNETPYGYSGNTSDEENDPHVKDDNDDQKDSDANNKDVCPICLCEYEVPAMVDQCFHKFCFLCILQWGQVGDVPRCPLCKQNFVSLIYDIESESEFKTHYVRAEAYKKALSSSSSSSSNKRPPRYTWGKKPSMGASAHALRRAVYLRGLKAKKCESNGPLFSPQMFRKDTSYWESKLRPWLTRELEALLEDEDVELLVIFILSLLQQQDINSEQAKEQLRSIFFEYLDTFIHEFLNFANSPYDMHTYDRLVKYDYSNAKQSKHSRSLSSQDGSTSATQNHSQSGSHVKDRSSTHSSHREDRTHHVHKKLKKESKSADHKD